MSQINWVQIYAKKLVQSCLLDHYLVNLFEKLEFKIHITYLHYYNYLNINLKDC